MKNLMQSLFGVPAFARRWVSLVKQKRFLQRHVEQLEHQIALHVACELRQNADIKARDAQIQALLVSSRQLPEEIVTLLKEADETYANALRGGPVVVRAGDMLTWRADWRAFRENSGTRNRW